MFRPLTCPLVMIGLLLTLNAASAQDAAIATRSVHDAATTLNKLKTAVTGRGFAIIAEVDHAAAAEKVGVKLRPTTLLIFGNPRGGSPIMSCNQQAGLDLPLRALVRQAEDGATFVDFQTPAALAARYRLADCAKPQIAGATKAIEDSVAESTR